MSGSSSRDQSLIAGVIAAAVALMVGLVAVFWQPAPPKVVVMSTGSEQGAYHAFAMQYRDILARSGIELVLQPSSGAIENLERLAKGSASVALVQGGTVMPGETASVESLGGMFYEPLWVFQRLGDKPLPATELAGKRIAVGTPGSGTRQLALEVLRLNLRPGQTSTPVEIGGLAAAQALQDGTVDIAMFVSAPEGEAVQRLLAAPGIGLLSFRRAEAYTRRLPYLTRLDLPEGAFDLARDIPAADTVLIATTASLLVSADLHPVAAELLLDAARQVHGRGDMLWRAGRFPTAESHDFVLSADAEAFYKNGSSLLRRYLPYWSVAWIQRLIVFGLPVLAIGLPLLRFLPGLYRWRVRRRVYRWYGELMFIERALKTERGDQEAQLRRLDAIESRLNALRVPAPYAGEAYALKMHMRMVRNLLDEHRTPPADDAPGG